MVLDKKLKEAIVQLASAEKDKLIFRLLKKDADLAERLYFELVSADSKEDRRKEAKSDIEQWVSETRKRIKYSTPGLMMMAMRDATGVINQHVKTTKDKYGEVYLQLFLFIEYLKIYNENFKDSSLKQSFKLNIYCITKAFKIMVLLKKLHEDLQFDFADDISEAGRLFGDNPMLMKAAIYNGFDVNWLICNNIPDDIEKIEKDLRQRGYLK